MTERERRALELVPDDGVDREAGLWLAALRNTRERMDEVLEGFPADLIDAVPTGGGNSVGALLYHIAIVEADWLFDEILGTIETDYPRDLFRVEMREDGNTLSSFTGETLAQHLERLQTTRTMLVEAISPMSSEQLHELHVRKGYDVSTAWVLHHLMQHEAQHRSQIGAVREAVGSPQPGW